MSFLQIIERHLRAKEQLSDSFHFYRWECFPKATARTLYYELEGAVCKPVMSGPRKGKPNYRTSTDKRVFVVTVDEAKQIESQYESDTGNCCECMGSGKTLASHSVVTGSTYRQCKKCSGTGKREEISDV